MPLESDLGTRPGYSQDEFHKKPRPGFVLLTFYDFICSVLQSILFSLKGAFAGRSMKMGVRAGEKAVTSTFLHSLKMGSGTGGPTS